MGHYGVMMALKLTCCLPIKVMFMVAGILRPFAIDNATGELVIGTKLSAKSER